jgi:hypothetical protein
MHKKFLFHLLIALTASSIVGANIYLWEDFEGFAPGESLDTSGVWVQQGSAALGVASDAMSYPAGGMSGYFEEQAGIRHLITEGELPGEFVISAWYYHDASGPPPHYMLVFRGPAGTDWLGVGTVETIENYSIRDKMGTGEETDTGVPRKDWVHIVWQVTQDGTEVFLDGQSVYTSVIPGDTWRTEGSFLWFANVWADAGYAYLDSIGIADTLQEIGEPSPLASNPNPADGVLQTNTWVNLTWSPGDFAVSHDVYLADNWADVTAGTTESFQGNQTATSLLVGFPGYPYPEGLVPGTTYYWRVDEVNDADPNSPWKGPVWNFSIAPHAAYQPDPADGAGIADTSVTLSWAAGYGAKMHTLYFGDDFDTVANATGGAAVGGTSYDPGSLESEKVYYWRVDEFDGLDTHKGDVWTFTTPGAVGSPQPANGAADLPMVTILTWTPATNAASHQVYLGLDKDAVRSADIASPEYKGSRTPGAESVDSGLLEANATYYWRVDAVYDGTPLKGPVWSFTVGAHLLIDDFEGYTDDDAAGQAIWQTWIDGFGVADNGAQVGYLMPPYAEQRVVHSGGQSMPLLYINEAGVTNSEATLPLTAPRDWTQGGVEQLSFWFRGASDNAAEPLYVAISNSTGAPAIVVNDDSQAAQSRAWTPWNIPLLSFADQGVNMTNVDRIVIGLGTKSGMPSAGGSGTMYIDDIRLCRP